jgi:hypothetical protein
VLENADVVEVVLAVLTLLLLRQMVLVIRRGWKSR